MATHPISANLPPSEPERKSEVRTWSDTRIVRECLAGDEHAWAALIDKYKRLIFSIAVKYGADRSEAADIFQAVCLDIFSQLATLRKTQSLKPWIISITAHKCFRWKRQRRVDLDVQDVEQDLGERIAIPTPELLEEAEKEQALREAIAQLAPRCQEMIRLLFYEDPPMPYAEVAKRLGLAVGSIGFTRAQCLKRLYQILCNSGF